MSELDDSTSASTTMAARVSHERRISPIWIVPLVALGIGLWMLVQSYLHQGPLIHVNFATAEGIIPNETQVKMLAVDLGTVKSVSLNKARNGVTVDARLVPEAEELLSEETQFWVVRPRVGSGGISGLSTILSGAYIELSPGGEPNGQRYFTGTDDVPLTPPDTPGIQVELISEDAASISVGSPVLYNGFQVGRIESANLDTHIGETRYIAFVDAPYNDLINASTRFWNASGVSISAGVAGFNVRMESLESLFTGGVAFGMPEDEAPGAAVKNGTVFRLYPDYETVVLNPYRYAVDYLLFFDSSVRGLKKDAPVEYRGLRVGTVVDVAFDHDDSGSKLQTDEDSAIAVLVRIEPGWLTSDSEADAEALDQTLAGGVANGLRASLSVGNLLTGSMYVEMDYYPDAKPAEISESAGYKVFPTVASGLDQIEEKIAGLLSKLQALPIDETLTTANGAMRRAGSAMEQVDATLSRLSAMLAEMQQNELPKTLDNVLVEAQEALRGLAPGSTLHGELTQALAQLQRTLLGAESVLETYDNQPNAVIFPTKRQADPVPGGRN